MSVIFGNLTGRSIDDLPLTEYLAGTEGSATFKTTINGGPAVIKLFSLDSAKADARLGALKLTEALSHPNLLRTIRTGRGELDGTPFVYLVTELAEENLGQVLPERPLTPQEAREVVESITKALTYLHSQGLVHADLKPTNIMAIGDQLKLSVDGVQRVDEPLHREPGAHDAPEAGQKLSSAADVWSLGVTLVEVLTQQLPPKPVSEASGLAVPESVPAPFREIAQHCLLRTPELRWSIAEITAKLNPKAPAVAPPAQPQPQKPSVVVPARRSGASKRPLILLAIVAVIVVAVVLMSRRGEQTSAPPVSAQQPVQAPATEEAKPEAAPRETKPTDEQPATTAKVAQPPTTTQHISDEPVEDAEANTTKEPATASGVVRKVMPQVIPQARNSINGKVRVKIALDVDASGNVTDSRFVSRGPSRYFAKVADSAARQWKFSPSRTEARAWNLEFEFRRSGTQVRASEAR